MLHNEEAVKYYEEKINYFYQDIYRNIAEFLIEYLSNHQKINLSEVISLVQESEYAHKEEANKEITNLTSEDNFKTPAYSKESMDELTSLITIEKAKLHQYQQIKEAFKNNPDPIDQARIIKEHNRAKKEEYESMLEKEGTIDEGKKE